MSRQGAGIPRTKTLANTQLEPTARGNGRAAALLQTLCRWSSSRVEDMSIESTADWNGLRAVAMVAHQTLALLARQVRAGITTGELDGMAARFYEANGARSAPAVVYGFPGNVLISINEEIVHGIPGGRRIAAGDLVSLDVTVEKEGYVADTARSVVVAPGSEAAYRLVACARAAFEGALVVARAGVRVSEIGRAVEREVRRQGFSVVHGLAGHGVGRTIHEPPTVPNEWDPHQQDVLTEVTRLRGAYQPEAPIPQQAATSQATSGAVQRLLAVVERYPELHSATNVMELQREIARIEDLIATRRELYNDAVFRYNTTIAQMPAGLIAPLFGWRPRAFFSVAPSEAITPSVDLGEAG